MVMSCLAQETIAIKIVDTHNGQNGVIALPHVEVVFRPEAGEVFLSNVERYCTNKQTINMICTQIMIQ